MFSIRFRFRRSEERSTCHFQAFGTKVLGIGNLSAWCSMVYGALLCLALCFFSVFGTLFLGVWHSWRLGSRFFVLLALYLSMFNTLGTLFLCVLHS
jgi:hypothetical protein